MKNSITMRCLKESINGESTAAKKYDEFSKIALKEGFSNVAYLFHALSKAEKIHIENHKRALGEEYEGEIEPYELSSTLDNVKDSIKGETWETKEMYPGFLKETKKERKEEYAKVGRLSMEWARDVEKTHAEVLTDALQALESGEDFSIEKLYICKFCGNLVYELPEKFCPICKHDIRFYMEVKRSGELSNA